MITIACGTGACLLIAGLVLGAGALLSALGLRGQGTDCEDHCGHCPGDHDDE